MNEQPTADTQQSTQKPEKKPTERRRPTDPIDYVDRLDIKLDGLKPIQNAAVVILLGGCTISEAAGMVGVHRNTIHRWIKNIPAFRKGLRGAQNEQREAVRAQLDAMGRKAAGAVEQAIDKGDPRIALQLLKGIGLLGDQTATRNPYIKRQAKQPQKNKPDWTRKWQLPTLRRFGRSEVMASSILLLLASLLVVGILNLAQAVQNDKTQAANLQQDPKSKFQNLKSAKQGDSPLFLRKIGTVPSEVQKLSVCPVVRNPVPLVVNKTTATDSAHLAKRANRPNFAEMMPARVQHSALFCICAPPRSRLPDG